MPTDLSGCVQWRGFLKLAVPVACCAVLVAGLFGSASHAQPAPTPTNPPTPVASILKASPAVLNLGTQIVLAPNGVAGSPKSVTLSVAGNQPAPVTIDAILVSDQGNPPQFIVQPNNCSMIPPGGKCSVPIVFQPSGTHSRKAILLISSNAANVVSVNLSGFGKQGAVTLNPRSLGFGTATVGAAATANKSITLSNNNPVPLTINGVSSSNPAVFVTNECPPQLQPNAQCTISASFAPTRNGAIRGQIFISDNAVRSPQKVRLSGNGTGGPTPTRTATATRTPPYATPAPTPATSLPVRTFPVMH